MRDFDDLQIVAFGGGAISLDNRLAKGALIHAASLPWKRSYDTSVQWTPQQDVHCAAS